MIDSERQQVGEVRCYWSIPTRAGERTSGEVVQGPGGRTADDARLQGGIGISHRSVTTQRAGDRLHRQRFEIVCGVTETGIPPVDEVHLAVAIQHYVVGLDVTVNEHPGRRRAACYDGIKLSQHGVEPPHARGVEQAGGENRFEQRLGWSRVGVRSQGWS